jgi:hypothetical protein
MSTTVLILELEFSETQELNILYNYLLSWF